MTLELEDVISLHVQILSKLIIWFWIVPHYALPFFPCPLYHFPSEAKVWWWRMDKAQGQSLDCRLLLLSNRRRYRRYIIDLCFQFQITLLSEIAVVCTLHSHMAHLFKIKWLLTFLPGLHSLLHTQTKSDIRNHVRSHEAAVLVKKNPNPQEACNPCGLCANLPWKDKIEQHEVNVGLEKPCLLMFCCRSDSSPWTSLCTI